MADPITAAGDAIAAYFQSNVDGLTARRGWPETDQALDLTQPLLTVELASADPTWVAPRLLGKVGSRWMWRIGWLSIQGQIDLWTAYRATREEMAPLVEDVFHNQLPSQTGLFLGSAGYNDARLEVSFGSGTPEADGDSANKGEWRQTWDCTVSTYQVAFSSHPTLASLRLSLSTELSSETVTETVST